MTQELFGDEGRFKSFEVWVNNRLITGKPICPYCKADMEPARVELSSGAWAFGWLCECTDGLRALVCEWPETTIEQKAELSG